MEGLALVDLSLAALHAACPANSNKVLLLEGDVSDEASVISYVERTVARFGRLDISVQNAGIAQAPVSIMEQSVDEWDKMQRINVRGCELRGVLLSFGAGS